MTVILFDSNVRTSLLPLTYARPLGDLRMGILTLGEKWHHYLKTPVNYITQAYIQPLFPQKLSDDNFLIDGSLRPSVEVVSWIQSLPEKSAFYYKGKLVAARVDSRTAKDFARTGDLGQMAKRQAPNLPLTFITRPSDLFSSNSLAIESDFELLTLGRTSQPLSATNTLIGPRENLFIEEGVTLEACTLNVEGGPIFIGRNATILEGSLLRGAIAVCAGAIIKMGTRIYGGTTLGPYCKVGGEISNVIFQANSNKGHDGYLGNAVIGEWCNLGADTNASNLKNDYGEVKVWSYDQERLVGSGLQFHGLIMGDHSKTGINTMLNTGTVIGFSSNVFGSGFPPNFIPSFSWGGGEGLQTYRLDKALATAERMMGRRNREFLPEDDGLFQQIFQDSEKFRKD